LVVNFAGTNEFTGLKARYGGAIFFDSRVDAIKAYQNSLN